MEKSDNYLDKHRIKDLSYIEIGDIVFVSQPSSFEVEYAALNRELLICRKQLREYKEIGSQIHSLSQQLL